MTQTILVVDDDKKIRTLFGKQLHHAGYKILYAENGQTGLELARKHQPAGIILDYQMPVMNGIQMLQILRNTEKIRKTPVILVTAASATHTIPNISQADLVLQKPVSPSELVVMLHRLIGSNRGQ